MTDNITNSARFQRILLEAAQYRVMRDIFEVAERRIEHTNDAADMTDERLMMRKP